MVKYLYITIGTLAMAVGLNGFLAPHDLVTGGTSGLALIFLRLFNIPMWLSNIVINLPLFIMATKLKGFKFTKDTMYATIAHTIFIGVTEKIHYFETDIVLGCIFGGILTGAGLGLVFRVGCATGGTDLAADLLKIRHPHVPVARIMLIIDIIIIGAGFFVLGYVPMLYAIVSVYVITKIFDLVLEGLDFAKAAFIISDKADIIGDRITSELKRGATFINGKGVYTKKDKNMIIAVISAKQIAKVREITQSEDKNSFVFISDVREILGEFEE